MKIEKNYITIFRQVVAFMFIAPLLVVLFVLMAILTFFVWVGNDDSLKETWRTIL